MCIVISSIGHLLLGGLDVLVGQEVLGFLGCRVPHHILPVLLDPGRRWHLMNSSYIFVYCKTGAIPCVVFSDRLVKTCK